jgi:hypothetical protein
MPFRPRFTDDAGGSTTGDEQMAKASRTALSGPMNET